MAAQTTKDCLNSRCPHFDILSPIMADRAGTVPLYTSESGVDDQPNRSNTSINPPSPSPQPQETQATQNSGWEPTQRLEPEFDDAEDGQNADNSHSLSQNTTRPNLAQSALSRSLERSSSSQSSLISKTLPRQNFIQPVKKPISENPRRTSAGTLGVLKSFQSSLPTQADYEQLKNENTAAAETNCLAFQQASSNSNAVMNLLEAQFGSQNSSEKRTLDPEDLTPEAIEKRKAKKAKTEELEMLKLERELAQERRALHESAEGSGLSKLELAREKADLISKFCLAHISLETAREMAQEIIDSLK
ncbi:uncharacterized protein MELLADRAFT_95877 [Melampsora larici-populina 98AG31]|uniref:Uncharacterized protein n=1 Tax=Melampsora larici-populina (strain 98AG31 / pathotype 3-4-7) TaxID=747676 RepID=F4RDK6_MELLP|nr:uncharacterized protein MELLADRAFT_95877 [Melampsora larici-populina 98AG31]EGG09593.1 hypothetical protein MELLADRAFT_95877 [Melampsora larici-populina 98AG31]